jgi:hypothetical protein
MTNEEITKEIIISMIQHDKIGPTSTKNIEELNSSYTQAVCKAFDTVYQTVSKTSKSKYETE